LIAGVAGIVRSRLLILVALLALTSIQSSGGEKAAAAETTLRIITAPFDVSMGVQYAQEHGDFKKYGLDAKIDFVRNGEAAAAAVIGGSADIGVANSMSLAIAHEKGVDLKYIAPAALYTDSNATTALLVANTSEIRSAKGLSGKTIALPDLSGLPPISMDAWLDKNGGDLSSVKFIEMPIAQMGTALHNHVVDAALVAEPGLSAALSRGDVRVLGLPFGAIAPRFLINGWYARGDWIREHPDIAKRFAKAVIEAQLWANQHPEESSKIMMTAAKLDPAGLQQMKHAAYTSKLDPGLLQPIIDIAAKYHALTGPFPAQDICVELP
jgi:NitT/TauT family transport system substrate-binding protein